MVKKVNTIDTSGLVKRTDYDAKITDIEGKIPIITGLSSTASIHADKNKISNFSNLVFPPVYRCLKKNGNNNNVSAWISKGLSDESIKPPTVYNNSLALVINYIDSKISLKFDGSCLKQYRHVHISVLLAFVLSTR